jgi:DNA-binding response OmpR family regulator
MTGRSRILLVIADDMLRQAVAEHLQTVAGWTLGETRSVESGLAVAAGHDLVVIDDSVAGYAEAPRRFRDQGLTVPLLVLCAPGGKADADLLVPKPLRLGALAHSIADLLARRVEPRDILIGPWVFQSDLRRLNTDRGQAIRLTDKETAILVRLARAGGMVVAREILLAEVWGYSAAITTHTLETHIYRLRRKIESDAGASGLLVTESGGYRLIVGS